MKINLWKAILPLYELAVPHPIPVELMDLAA